MSDTSTKTILISGTENAIDHIKVFVTFLENATTWKKDEDDSFSVMNITDEQLEVITRALVHNLRNQESRELAREFDSKYASTSYGGSD